MRARLRSLEQLMPFATAVGALHLMQLEDVGFLPVLDEGELVGVLSERDIARGAMLEQRVFVRDIMTIRLHTVAPETKVPDCVTLMHRERIRHLPVMSGVSVLGVLSVRDLMSSLVERHERLLRRLNEERLMLLFPYPSSY